MELQGPMHPNFTLIVLDSMGFQYMTGKYVANSVETKDVLQTYWEITLCIIIQLTDSHTLSADYFYRSDHMQQLEISSLCINCG